MPPVPATPTLAFLMALAKIQIASADVLSLWTLDLFVGSPTLSIASVLGDLTFPSFSGYAAVSLTPPALAQDGNGDLLITWPEGVFQASGAVSPGVTATGVCLHATISAADTLLLAGYLATPVTFNSALDAVSIIFQSVVPNQLVYGGIAAQV